MSNNDKIETRNQETPPPRPAGPPPRSIFENETRSNPKTNGNNR